MRLATVQDPVTNAPVVVLQRPQGWVPLRELPGAADWTSDWNWSMADAFRHLETIAKAATTSYSIGRPYRMFLPPVIRPATFRDFYAFEQHVKTCRAKRGLEVDPNWYAQPVFYFSNPIAMVGDKFPVYAPDGSQELDYELELAAIIGRGGKDIDPANAWQHIAGFTILNDFSARDLQRREVSVGLGPAKGKDFATAVGPYLLTVDELHDRIDASNKLHLSMTARVNGREWSKGNAADMHFTWPQLIAQASRDAELLPGDVIGSGTVGTGCILELGPENTGGWLKPGDIVELQIERLGTLNTPIVARPHVNPLALGLPGETARPR